MKTPTTRHFLACVLALAGLAALPASAQRLDIASDPLGTGLSSIKPNVMFILDDSGSMGRDHMPDFVTSGGSGAACFDHGDDGDTGGGSNIGGTPNGCVFGDPPYNSPDFNTIYYNPDLRYRPAINADTTEMPVQDSANTTAWTAVRTNPYQNTSTTNIITGYEDRVWCTNQSDSATGGNCRQNSAYNFPNAVFPYGEDTAGDIKYIAVSPYVYRMQTRQFCTNAARTTCVSGSNINPATHTFPAPEFCEDEELTRCVAGALVTPASAWPFSGVRWCNDPTLTEDALNVTPRVKYCQRKRIGAFQYAKHIGLTVNGTVPARQSEGNIQVTSVNAAGGTVLSITIGTSTLTAASIVVGAGSTATTVAGQIANAINSGPFSGTYDAVQSGNNVVVTSDATGTAENGKVITVNSSTVATTAARGVISIDTAGGSTTITSIRVNGQQLLTCAPLLPQTFGTGSSLASWTAGGGTNGALSRIIAPSGSSNTTRRTNTRDALRLAIDTCAQTPPGGTGPWDASSNGTTALNITAPLNLGDIPNTWTIDESGGVTTTICNMGVTGCGGTAGVMTKMINSTTAPMSGGATAFTGRVRTGVGQFTRTDIVPAINSYPKSTGRTDCAGVTCTYDEEMTNFANWYAYHRTRMQMMKAAAGRAFANLNDGFRVGFITICPVSGNDCQTSAMGYNVVSSKYLKIADYDDPQRVLWYGKLYGTNPSGFTPLREALSRVGLIYAGQFGAGLTGGLTAAADDPVTASCQPNFAILSTDGYWNGDVGRQTNNSSSIGNQDNTDSAPYSTQADGVYDGGTPVASNTLADVALHYYKTDLRPSMSDTVPVTEKDFAQHQHMVSFTIGLGLDGALSYRPDYETATTGDFVAIKQGSVKWPVPVADSPTALDDLWHAAVNGRGVFFSAKNPDQVAQGLSDSLEQLQARVGAGAAAATSNLQPVAGDNFAFTAQYQTVDWIGDLKARTIDLGTGTVSAIQLWSAAELLDARLHTDRQLFTFDSGDAAGNRMKHFCMNADLGAAWCNDGAGLTAAEVNLFDPALIALSQEGDWTVAGVPSSLVNYLRGDTSKYNSGVIPRGANDLYRARTSVLGDIVNAQPSYVRASPFSYGDTDYFKYKACTEGTAAALGVTCPAGRFPDPTKPRRGTVYAASNDGMLHAFETDVNNNPYFQTAGITTPATLDDTFTGNNAGNGAERWAYIPGLVLPDLHQLANEPYVHRYLVDGSPTIADICITTPCGGLDDWRTILVGGLNAGGRGYYALDVSNPSATGAKALWEFGYSATCVTTGALGVPSGGPHFADCHMGLSYGVPIVTKLNGKWVVLVTSGYNNGSTDGAGNGGGYLYILDAVDGHLLHRLATGAGSAASPSGIAKVVAYATDSAVDNSALYVYGGDMQGNLWRFDLNFDGGTNANYLTATLVAVAKDALGNTQPISVKPEVADAPTVPKKPIVMFGTGRFLESGDKTGPFTTQTIYAIKDEPTDATGPVIADVRGASMKQRVFAAGVNPGERTIAAGSSPAWATDSGWYIDLPDSGERVNIDPQLQLGTLTIASNTPTLDTCTAGGESNINYLDYLTGSYVEGAPGGVASIKIGSSLAVGINVIMLPGGKVVAIVTTASNQQLTQNAPVAPTEFTARRVSWRELVVE